MSSLCRLSSYVGPYCGPVYRNKAYIIDTKKDNSRKNVKLHVRTETHLYHNDEIYINAIKIIAASCIWELE